MSVATVYRFKVFDVVKGEYVMSRRRATKDAIEKARGVAIDSTEAEIATSLLNSEGMTEKDFVPVQ